MSYFNKQQVEILSRVVHKLIQYTNEKQKRLTPCLLVSSADNLSKRVEPRSGPTERRSRSFSKPFDTPISFLKEFFEDVHYEKNQQTTESVQKYPSCNGLMRVKSDEDYLNLIRFLTTLTVYIYK